jgi:hypothetical protein
MQAADKAENTVTTGTNSYPSSRKGTEVSIHDRAVSPDMSGAFTRIAGREGRSLVMVGATATQLQLGWADFLDALGGGVPSCRALAPEYESNLLTTGSNKLPDGVTGEAWRLFEDLVADGFELVFGRVVILSRRKACEGSGVECPPLSICT